MDKIIAGSLVGLGAGIVIGIISFGLYMLNICQMCLIAIGGGVLWQEMLVSNAPLSWILIGWITHLIISGLLGVFIIYVLYLTGWDFALLKGLLIGTAFWFIDIVFISSLAGYISRTANPVDLLIILAYHMLYGILAAWLLVRYVKPTFSPNS